MEPLIYLALFLLVAVASLLFRWLKAQIAEAPTDRLEAGPWTAPPRPARVIPAKARAETGGAAPPSRVAPLPLPLPLPARLAARGGRRALRRGIVWMTILGPCRGLEPPRRIAEVGTELDPRARRR